KGEWNIPFCQKPERFSRAYITKIVNQVYDIACLIQPDWIFLVESFENTIKKAKKGDIIYCDPPYIGRYVDYYSGWTEEDERRLFDLLSATPARFILSTWHHNDFRGNPFIDVLWGKFNIVTRDHFYHSGGKIENRKSIVEALVFNFEANIKRHNHDVCPQPEQLMLCEDRAEYITQQLSRTDV
ncbi:MAG: DNA adenine methylase, partial [Nitrospirota bacterium]|nr:DNA adenine methylase [Nitrospirota bacterium]